MSAKTVYTCDYCNANVSPYVGEQWRTVFFTTGPNMPDLHACSKEHMGLALAKACGINIEVQTPANSCTDADRTQYEITIEQQKGRIAELESTLYFTQSQRNDMSAKIAELERRLAEATAPLAVDGKTPGQVLHDAFRSRLRAELACNDPWTWDECPPVEKAKSEHDAAAVLHAFGPVLAKQAAVSALRQIRMRLKDRAEGVEEPLAFYYHLAPIIDAEIASLEAPKPTDPPSITIPTKPTRPLVLTSNCTICGCPNERAFLELCRGDAKHNFEVTQ